MAEMTPPDVQPSLRSAAVAPAGAEAETRPGSLTPIPQVAHTADTPGATSRRPSSLSYPLTGSRCCSSGACCSCTSAMEATAATVGLGSADAALEAVAVVTAVTANTQATRRRVAPITQTEATPLTVTTPGHRPASPLSIAW